MQSNQTWIIAALPLALLASVFTAGCGTNSAANHAGDDQTYGSNRTLDPGDITGVGTSGNIRGLAGFAPSTSQPSR